ncbi:DUF732 domain-containing protein [Mycolicibacterium gadium]|uniref:DUF732 domain-containing protein n=1 Tax=Mycolicibacterium gadium TaxID=1794 RepID=A0ABT6GVK4_MYCGU|nr:DUF732 domain-containing protein [Mycolicibacterium gadium]MDG5485075.1 hypothetical protein [Mycolicibacterium gadium]
MFELKYRVGALISIVPAAVVLAAPATADEDGFVRSMQTTYAFLTDQQLRTEGAKICSTLRGGTPASDAVIMVRNDLGVSISAAGEIVSAAVVQLDC